MKDKSNETYVQRAMLRAQFAKIEDGTWFGSIPGFQGVWANRKTLEDCRQELKEVLEGWLIYSAQHNLEVPVLEDDELVQRRHLKPKVVRDSVPLDTVGRVRYRPRHREVEITHDGVDE